MAQRSRRLVADVLDEKGQLKEPGEERRLLAATEKNPGLQRLIIAALETGCRRGELLALTWADVSLERGELLVRRSKTGTASVLPITPRLAAVLEMAKIDPAGKEYKPTAYVFGVLGEQIGNPKRAWETAVLKAHGYTPVWRRGTLAPESRAQLEAIDLHFHDLRHEAGSRLLEAGWPIHHVKEMLGHATISQTDTYLNAAKMGLHDSMKRFGTSRRNPVAIEPENEHPLDGDKEKQETQKSLVN
jgi:integrase